MSPHDRTEGAPTPAVLESPHVLLEQLVQDLSAKHPRLGLSSATSATATSWAGSGTTAAGWSSQSSRPGGASGRATSTSAASTRITSPAFLPRPKRALRTGA